MTTSPTVGEFSAALLWLRNHYDVGDPKLKAAVLRVIDPVLDARLPSAAEMQAFGKKIDATMQPKEAAQ